MEKDFNKIIKNKLEFYEENPPSELLHKIRQDYPKRSFVESVRYNKFYLMGGAILLVVALGILFNINNHEIVSEPDLESNKSLINEESVTHEQISKTKRNNNDIRLSENDITNIPEDIQPENIKYNLEPSVAEVMNIDIFDVKDTMVCNNVYENKYIENLDKIILPENIDLINNGGIIQFVSSKPGKYLIKYFDRINNTILKDSMYVYYNLVKTPEVNFSSDVGCYNEEFLVYVKGNDKNLSWNIDNSNLKKLDKNNYRISGLKPGSNNIQLMFSDGECNAYFEKEITVLDKLDYKYGITPSYCSGSNASISVSPVNYIPKFYVLDENIINETGKFENLKSGIHTIKINYGQDCYSYDTLFIPDILNLNPYFTVEKDPIIRNKYYFRNHTKVDDDGYEKNNEIRFIWKINGAEFSHLDNPDYEFKESGSYLVEITAKIYDDCESKYSENIIIADHNINIPNIFTPNGDGIGDYFEILYDGELINYNMIITNSQGEKIFENNNINKSWDGKIYGNNDAPEGRYYYVITGEDIYGNKINQAGIVQLVRR